MQLVAPCEGEDSQVASDQGLHMQHSDLTERLSLSRRSVGVYSETRHRSLGVAVFESVSGVAQGVKPKDYD